MLNFRYPISTPSNTSLRKAIYIFLRFAMHRGRFFIANELFLLILPFFWFCLLTVDEKKGGNNCNIPERKPTFMAGKSGSIVLWEEKELSFQFP
jgi:hypothetical protein